MKILVSFLLVFAAVTAIAQKKQCFADFKMHYADAEYEEAVATGLNCPAVRENEETHHHLVRSLMFRKQYDAARNEYQKLLVKNPESFDYCNGLGAAYYQLEKYDSSEIYYSKAIAIDPKSDKGYYNRSMLYYVKDELSKAKADMSVHLKNFPQSADGYALLGDILLADSLHDKSLEAYNTALGLDPHHVEALEGRAEYYFQRDDYKLGLADIDHALIYKKEDANLYFMKGDLYYFMDEEHYKEALTAYQKALKIEEDAETHYQIGSCYEYLKKYKEAIESYLSAIEHEDQDADFYGDLAFVYYKQQEYEKALQTINSAIKLNPEDDFHYSTRGYIYSAMRKPEKALKSFLKADNLAPNDSETKLNIGHELEELGKHEEALEYYTTAYALSQDASILYYRGYLLAQMGRTKAALADQLKVIETDPTDTYALYEAASCYAELGNNAKCCEYMNMAVNLGDKDAKEYAKKHCP